MIIQPATSADLPTLVELRDQSREWLAAHGSDQWQNPWPTRDAMVERLQTSIDAGETWMVYDGDQTITTLALDRYADPQLWTPEERDQPAFYLHRLIVDRDHAGHGHGANLIDWPATTPPPKPHSGSASTSGPPTSRSSATTSPTASNTSALKDTDYPSGALFQRLALPPRTHDITERTTPTASPGRQ